MMQKEEIKQKKNKRATGRAVFSINPNLFVDDDAAADDEEIKEETKEEEPVEFKDIIDEHEEERLWKEIEEAQKMTIEENLFQEEVEDVDLDDV